MCNYSPQNKWKRAEKKRHIHAVLKQGSAEWQCEQSNSCPAVSFHAPWSLFSLSAIFSSESVSGDSFRPNDQMPPSPEKWPTTRNQKSWKKLSKNCPGSILRNALQLYTLTSTNNDYCKSLHLEAFTHYERHFSLHWWCLWSLYRLETHCLRTTLQAVGAHSPLSSISIRSHLCNTRS